MSKLVWDQTSERLYETGVDRGVVYPQVGAAYPKGAAWNGLIGVTLSPSGAEPTPLYANNAAYMRSYRYEVTVIDGDPDCEYIEAVLSLPMCTFDRHFVSDNLHHNTFTLYY